MKTREGGRDAHPTAGEPALTEVEGTPTLRKPAAAIKASVSPPSDRSAGVPPAVSGASRPRFGEVKIRDRGRLPHWEKENATYFVTFRLDDSLPKMVLERIDSKRESLVKTDKELRRELTTSERKRIKQLTTKIVERYLDNGVGACHLKHPAVAGIVADALRHFDNRRYRLFSWCVMPNHVHVVVRVREYYDHLVQDDSEFERAVRYVAENPDKAGLHNGGWVWVGGRDANPTAGETPALRKPGTSR